MGILKKKEIKERIMSTLEKHPEGLMIKDIAKEVGIHRINIGKYLYELLGAGEIFERPIGPAKLYYLKKVRK